MRSPAALALATGIVLGSAGCGGLVDPHTLVGGTMGTTYRIKYVGSENPFAVQREIDAALVAFNAVFSTYEADSEISRFNAHESTEPFEASAELSAMVRRALEIAAWTDGAFDPTMLPLVNLQGFGPDGRQQEPSAARVREALDRVGYTKLKVLDDGRLQKSVPGLQLDLSAMAKGGGVDRIGELLTARGITDYMVEIGGEVRCRGEKSSGRPWRIGIEGPGSTRGEYLVEELALRDAALATSGSYRNFVESGGVRKHHIFDPRTGTNPDNGVVSVSVLASDCALADSLATALMIGGVDVAETIFDRFSDTRLEALFVIDEGEGAVRTQRVRWTVDGTAATKPR